MSLETKLCKLDAIPAYIIKENIDEFLEIYRDIINASLQEGKFADEWKIAILRPLLKNRKLDHKESNYRPVSNLSFLSKVTGSAAIRDLVRFNNHNKTTSEHQSAYKEYHSCETLLVKLINDIHSVPHNSKF